MFIVFEGLDSAGKRTQIGLLEARLKAAGYSVQLVDFPAYETEFGSLVGKYLRGEYGPMSRVASEVAFLLYALDRYQFKESLFAALKAGRIVIANRYTQSNLAFQGAKFGGRAMYDFIRWGQEVESRLPRPNLIVLLDVPPAAAERLITRRPSKGYLKGKTRDIHEEDAAFQAAVRRTYLEIAKAEGWLAIKCAVRSPAGWRMRTPEDIHAEIWSRLGPMIAWFAHKPSSAPVAQW